MKTLYKFFTLISIMMFIYVVPVFAGDNPPKQLPERSQLPDISGQERLNIAQQSYIDYLTHNTDDMVIIAVILIVSIIVIVATYIIQRRIYRAQIRAYRHNNRRLYELLSRYDALHSKRKLNEEGQLIDKKTHKVVKDSEDDIF